LRITVAVSSTYESAVINALEMFDSSIAAMGAVDKHVLHMGSGTQPATSSLLTTKDALAMMVDILCVRKGTL